MFSRLLSTIQDCLLIFPKRFALMLLFNPPWMKGITSLRGESIVAVSASNYFFIENFQNLV